MAGRPTGTYKLSVEALELAWEEYKLHCEQQVRYVVNSGIIIKVPNPLIYTVEDYCDYAGIDDDTFNEYGKISNYSATIKKIRKAIFARKQRALVNGEGSTTGLIFDMKANYGINDKNLIEHSGEVTNKIIIEDATDCEPLPVDRKEDEGYSGV